MKEYIDKLKEIETLVELSIGTTMTEEKATDIYSVTNELMSVVKKLNDVQNKQLLLFHKLLENNMCSIEADEMIKDILMLD